MLIKIFSGEREPLDLYRHLMEEQGLASGIVKKNPFGSFYTMSFPVEGDLSGGPRELLAEACLPYGLDFRPVHRTSKGRQEFTYKLFDKAQRERYLKCFE